MVGKVTKKLPVTLSSPLHSSEKLKTSGTYKSTPCLLTGTWSPDIHTKEKRARKGKVRRFGSLANFCPGYILMR